MHRILLLSITTLAIAPPVLGNDLMRLYELAQTHDASLQVADALRDVEVERLPQARAELLPEFAATAFGTRERTDASPSENQSTSCALSQNAQAQHCYGSAHGFDLTLSQPLWDFESFSRLKEARALAASADADLASAQQDLLLRVAQAYFEVLAAKDRLQTNRNEREAFSALLEQARAREQTGVGPRSAVEQAQGFYDLTEQSVLDAQNALDDALLTLGTITGTSPDEIAPLREDIPLISPEPASVDAWVKAVRDANPELRAAYLKSEAFRHDISAQRGKGMPVIVLKGSSSKSWFDPNASSDQILDTVGVALSWPIFQSGQIASAVRQSRARHRQAQAEYEVMLRNAEQQTRVAYRSVVTGIERIAAAKRAMNSTRITVEASRRNIEFGTGSEFELLSSQTNHFSAARSYNQTRYDYLTGMLTLKRQAGQLTQRDLAAIDALLVEGP